MVLIHSETSGFDSSCLKLPSLYARSIRYYFFLHVPILIFTLNMTLELCRFHLNFILFALLSHGFVDIKDNINIIEINIYR